MKITKSLFNKLVQIAWTLNGVDLQNIKGLYWEEEDKNSVQPAITLIKAIRYQLAMFNGEFDSKHLEEFRYSLSNHYRIDEKSLTVEWGESQF